MLEIIAWMCIFIAGFAVVNGLWVWFYVRTEMAGEPKDESTEKSGFYFPPVWGDLPHYTHVRS